MFWYANIIIGTDVSEVCNAFMVKVKQEYCNRVALQLYCV